MRAKLIDIIDSVAGKLLAKQRFYNEKSRLAYGLSVMNPNTQSSKKHMLEHSTQRAINKIQGIK